MELMTAKGVRDLSPREKIVKENIVTTLKNIFERFGFSPIETPILERYETLASKYSGGAEILKETFRLKDQGNRELALRYDLTVSLCRFISMNKNIKMPFKTYQIDHVFRDGPLKAGRYREFWQCDADCIGTKSLLADAEMILILRKGLKEIKIPSTIVVNNRKLLNDILNYCKVSKEKSNDAILSLDKLSKIGVDGVSKELEERGINKEQIKNILNIFSQIEKEKSMSKKIEKIKDIIGETEGVKELEEVFSYIEDKTDITFDPSLARGLAYYTSTVYEAFAKNASIKSSIAAGGRYDNMINNFINSKEQIPAVGCSFGLEPILDILSEKAEKKTLTKIYIIPIKTLKESAKIANNLRKDGLNVDIDLMGRNISKNLQYADSYKIPYVLIIGENELKDNKVQLKNMITGKEDLIELKNIKKFIL